MDITEEKFSRYDRADYLTDDERIAAYLKAAVEEAGNDPLAIAQAYAAMTRARNIS